MPNMILTNGTVYTLSNPRPKGSAIAVAGDRIMAVGNEEVLEWKRPATQVIDLQRATVIPALCDAHIHWSWTARTLHAVNLLDVPTKEEAVRLVGERVAKTEPGKWIEGRGWAQGLWPVPDFPTAADLDDVSPNNPVYLRARSGHAVWLNSVAMKLAGITDSTPNPPGGEIQRDANGRATGILLEEAEALISRVAPHPTPQEIADAMEEAQELGWQSGLGAIHDYDGPDAFAAFQILRDRGKLGLRVVKNINDPYIHHAYALGLRWGMGDAWLRIGGLKIFADGALGSVTAQMIEPFEGQPHNRGIIVTPKEKMRDLVLEGTRRGFPATIHAIGDEAVRHTLDVLEEARALEAELGIPRDARRHRIEHVQLVHPDDLNRLAELDIIASIQPIHATADYSVADLYWGERARLSYNARVQLDAGARVAFGSDAPVEPFEPFKGIHASVTRRRADGSPGTDGWYPEARLTVDETIRGFTQGPAYAAGLENELGTLAPGYLADLIVLDRDPYKIDPNELLNVNVVATMTGGIWRHGPWKG